MKQEEVNQAVNKGGLVLAATGTLREQVLERVRRLIDGVHYVTLSDLLREVNEIKLMLSRMRTRGQMYTVAIDAEIAKSVMLALLLVPESQAKLPAQENAGHAGSGTEAAQLAKAADDARQIAERLWAKPNAVPTFEGWNKELSKLGDSGALAEQLLVAPRTEGAQAHDSNGRPFVEVPTAPKALPSEHIHEVELHIRMVDPETHIATVRLIGNANQGNPALLGLNERRIPLWFDDEKLPGVSKLLELAQTTDVHVHVRVNVTRGLSRANAKLDKLELAEVIRETELRQRMARRLLEMNAVTEDLFSKLDGPGVDE
jgi:hypothetical protein